MNEPAWLVDTNVLSHFLRREAPQEYPLLVAWLKEALRAQQAAISAVTLHELRRGIKADLDQGKSRKKAVRMELLLRSIPVLGLDAGNFSGWAIATELWAKARARRPPIVFEEGDLFIFATAVAHGRKLATADRRLWERLRELGRAESVHLVELR